MLLASKIGIFSIIVLDFLVVWIFIRDYQFSKDWDEESIIIKFLIAYKIGKDERELMNFKKGKWFFKKYI